MVCMKKIVLIIEMGSTRINIKVLWEITLDLAFEWRYESFLHMKSYFQITILKEYFQDTTSFFIDETWYTLYTAKTCKLSITCCEKRTWSLSGVSRYITRILTLDNTFNVDTENFTMTLSSSFPSPITSFLSCWIPLVASSPKAIVI